MTKLLFPLNITLYSPRPIFKAYITADRNTYGVGYYDKRETIYIFAENTN